MSLRRGRMDLQAARRLVADEERRCLERAEDLCDQAEHLLEDVRRYRQVLRTVDFRPLRDELERAIQLAQRVEAGLTALSAAPPGTVDLREHAHTGNGRDPAGAKRVRQ